jgi:hypothetical protein
MLKKELHLESKAASRYTMALQDVDKQQKLDL